MRRALRWVSMAGVACVLAVGLAIGVPGVTPVQQAQATLCGNSLTCNPANLPLLVDAGIMTADVAGGATPVRAKPTGSRIGLIARMIFSTVDIFSGLFFGSGFFDADDEEVPAEGGMSDNGFTGQTVQTNPEYAGAPTSACKPAMNRDGFMSALNGGTLSLPGACGLPYQVVHTSGNFSFSAPVLSATLSGQTATVVMGPATSAGTSATRGTRFDAVCRTAAGVYSWQSSTTGSSITPGAVGTTGNVSQSTTCSAVKGLAVAIGIWPNGGENPIGFVASTTVAGPGLIGGQLRTTVQCKSATGTRAVVGTVAVSMTAGQALTMPDVLCADGEIATGTTIDWNPGTGWQTIGGSETVPEVLTDLPTTDPGCLTMAAPCELRLWQVEPDGTLVSCGMTGEACLGWAQNPSAPDKYRCTYGGKTVALDRCSPYRAPEVGILPGTKPDGTPGEYDDPVPKPLPNPIGKPGTTTGTVTPSPGAAGGPKEGQADADCFPTGWGVLNPMEWVLKPVKCALQATFVPRQAKVDAQFKGIAAKWQRTAPAAVVTMVNGWDFDVSVGGCSGLPINWSSWDNRLPDQSILNACPGTPLAPVAFASYWFLGLIFVAGSVYAVARYLGGVVSFGGLGGN